MSSQENTIMRLQPGALQQRTPVRSRCDVTMDAIKSYILRERLQPGDLLPTEIELCEAVGASRSSVREAVRKLEGLNIVNVEHGRGTFVGSLSLDPMVETLAFRSMVSVGKNFDDLKDVVELRRFLDLGCADEVCAKVKGTEQPELDALVDAMVSSAERGEDFLYADIDFPIWDCWIRLATPSPSRWCIPCGSCTWPYSRRSAWRLRRRCLTRPRRTVACWMRRSPATPRCTVRPCASITGRSNRYCANTSPCADAWSLRGIGPRSVCAARHEARCTNKRQMSDV